LINSLINYIIDFNKIYSLFILLIIIKKIIINIYVINYVSQQIIRLPQPIVHYSSLPN